MNRVSVGARLVEPDLAATVADVELDGIIPLERHMRVPTTRGIDERDLVSDLDLYRVRLVRLPGHMDGGARPRSSIPAHTHCEHDHEHYQQDPSHRVPPSTHLVLPAEWVSMTSVGPLVALGRLLRRRRHPGRVLRELLVRTRRH